MSSVEPASRSFPPGTIFSHQPNGGKLRRKVVVDDRSDNLICLPITTNGGYATAKFDRARQSKHAIIYTGKKPPNPLRGECHLRKTAIRAIIIESPKTLNKPSRVDYSTEVPVDHADELSHLGWVESVDILLGEWKKVRGDAEFGVQGTGATEVENAGGGDTSQSRPSRSDAEMDAQERTTSPQSAAACSESLPTGVRAGKSIAKLKPNQVIVRDGCMMKLSKIQKKSRGLRDSSSNDVSNPPRPVHTRNAPERTRVSAAPLQQTRRPTQGPISGPQNSSPSPDSMVTDDILTEKIEAAVSRAMAAMDSNKQKAAAVEEVIKQTGIHSQVNGYCNVFQVKPMFSGPPPPYDVMDFEVSEPSVGQRRTQEPEPSTRRDVTADRSSSDAPASNVPPPAPMPPSNEMETLEQDNYEESDISEDEPEYRDQSIDLQMPDRKVQHALNTYMKPHQIGTGRGSSSSQAESSGSGSQQQQKRNDTLFLFFKSDRQQVGLAGRLDTGADGNFISPRAAREIAHSYHKYRGRGVEVANSQVERPEWLIFTYWAIENSADQIWHDRFIVFNKLPCDVIIGLETIKRYELLRESPKYQGCLLLLRFTASEGKKEKENQKEERRRRQAQNRQLVDEQNRQTYQEFEQEMHAQQGYARQNGQ